MFLCIVSDFRIREMAAKSQLQKELAILAGQLTPEQRKDMTIFHNLPPELLEKYVPVSLNVIY